MGKLLTGRYGEEPTAESIPLSLRDCSQKLGLKPSDFISQGAPKFFKEKFGASGRYLVFCVEADETQGSPVWKAGYYLLPLEAADILKALEGNRHSAAGAGRTLPVQMESEETPPRDVQERLDAWVAKAQPLFFKCGCDHLELKLAPPWGLRRRWKARLKCPKRCQPPLTAVI